MTNARRLVVAVGGLALTAMLCTQLWGDDKGSKDRRRILPETGSRPAAKAADPEAALARSKFAEGGVVTYRP